MEELNVSAPISYGDITFTIWDKRAPTTDKDVLSRVEGKYTLLDNFMPNHFTVDTDTDIRHRKKLYSAAFRQFELLVSHCGIIHRDIRKENMLIEIDGDDATITVVNFENVEFISDKVVKRVENLEDLEARKAAEERIIDNYLQWDVKPKLRAIFWVV